MLNVRSAKIIYTKAKSFRDDLNPRIEGLAKIHLARNKGPTHTVAHWTIVWIMKITWVCYYLFAIANRLFRKSFLARQNGRISAQYIISCSTARSYTYESYMKQPTFFHTSNESRLIFNRTKTVSPGDSIKRNPLYCTYIFELYVQCIVLMYNVRSNKLSVF